MSALKTQVGGDHYKGMAIQPMEYSMANGLDACQHTIVKYVSRFREKGGIQDLEKARHVLDMLIELEQKKVPLAVSIQVHKHADQPANDNMTASVGARIPCRRHTGFTCLSNCPCHA